MRTWVVVVSIAIGLAASAGPRKVLVLPLDGNAPQRAKLNASVVKLAKKLGGEVTAGDTTFVETAAAVGCDPQTAACAQTVLTTLGVDELVYGTATKDARGTTVVVKRVRKGGEPKSQTATLAATDAPDKAEAELEPVFTDAEAPAAGSGATEGSGSGSGSGAGSAEQPPGPRPRPAQGISFLDTTDRKLGVATGIAGVALIAVGIGFWAGKESLQSQIDAHATRTVADFQDLKRIEDQAADRALVGNITFFVGVGLAGAAAYFFYHDSQHRPSATVTPAPVESGAGMTLVYGGRW